jgi:phosphatidylglycerophosphatase C
VSVCVDARARLATRPPTSCCRDGVPCGVSPHLVLSCSVCPARASHDAYGPLTPAACPTIVPDAERISFKSQEIMALALFDFDGTVTFADSFTPFVYFAAGWLRIIAGSIVLSPLIIGYKLGLVPTPRIRAAVAYVCFSRRKEADVDDLGRQYAETLGRILRPEAMERIRWHQAQGHRVVIVSASLAPYLRYWCAALGVDLICTELEACAGTLTGHYLEADCTGAEKARRVAARYVLSSYSDIYAYGDTHEDIALLRLATKPYFRGREVTAQSIELHTSVSRASGRMPAPR